MRGCRLPVFALAAVLLRTATAAFGQTTGDISGRVTDSSETPLASVTVEATSPSLPGVRVTRTDGDGRFRIPALPPGGYRIRAALPGIAAAEKTCIVALDSSMTVDLELRIEAREEILISGETPPVDTSSTTTGTSYTSDVIERLPVIRNYADVVRANPGVGTDRGETEDRFLPLSVYGATSAENQWFIDGVNTTNVQRGIQGKALSSEFIQEVEIKTGGYQAEYGRALGGVINAITKSGGNDFHGDAFLYFDSIDTIARQRLEAGDSEIAGMRLLDAERYDYGFGLGGYLFKDRLWFFAAYNRATLEGELSRNASTSLVPRDARFPFQGVDNLYSGKLTWNASPSTTAVATVLGDPSTTSGVAGAYPRQGLRVSAVPVVSLDPATWHSERSQGGLDYGLRLTHLFGSRALATAQGSYHEDDNSLHADENIRYIDLTCVGGTRENPCRPPPEANSITGGYGRINLGASERRQFSGNVGLFAGKHELKAGGDYMNGRTALLTRFTGGQIVTILNEFGETYYQHQYRADSPTATTPNEGISRSARVIDFGAYVQDSWKLADGLTVNAGLRWDGEDTRNYLGRTVYRFRDGWQPRIGVAWDPWRNGKLKIFGFVGRFSGALPTNEAVIAFASISNFFSYNFDPISVVHDPNVGRARRGSSGTATTLVDEGIENWYQDELTLGVERALAPTTTIGLKGTYRRLGRALDDRCDLDYNHPDSDGSECAMYNPGSGGQFARGDMPVCDTLYDAPEGNQCFATGPAAPAARRLYRGIELLLRQSVSGKLWVQASYVYSSLRGNYEGGITASLPALWHNGYGTLSLDRPNRFRLDGWWKTPLPLTVGLQGFVESGAPLNKLGWHSLAGPTIFLVPRGSAGRLPTLWEANLTLAYPISVGPMTVTLQGYVHNLFNNQIVTGRDEAWSNSPPAGWAATIFDPNQEQTNPNYGKVTARSAPRSFRAAMRVSF